ncbi:MAG TPA: orotidine-5'-phosphate decarboxylase [Gemmatimonadales bacterium]|nr:orotidine-5'-phosphate decarboxylase [Gemmatimonadales bacterium]
MAELFVALDLPDAPSAVALLDLLPDRAPVKVGSVLMTRAGSGFIRSLVANGHPVFLDLKWHDIPNTVRGAVEAALDLGVSMVTVHALGGPAMIEAAAKAAGDRIAVVAVTVLTSHDAEGFGAVVGRETPDLSRDVVRLARLAMGAGAAGVVCSAEELAAVVPVVGQGRVVVPGIRRAEDALGDQARVATPEAALAAGATDLVVGRPIVLADDPAASYLSFRQVFAPI